MTVQLPKRTLNLNTHHKKIRLNKREREHNQNILKTKLKVTK